MRREFEDGEEMPVDLLKCEAFRLGWGQAELQSMLPKGLLRLLEQGLTL